MALALLFFQNCTQFRPQNSQALLLSTGPLPNPSPTPHPSPTPTPTPSPAATPTPSPTPSPTPVAAQSIYVGASLKNDQTCSSTFSGTRPTGMSASSYPSYGGVTVQYLWDFPNSKMWNEQTRYGYSPGFNPDRVSFAANGRPMIRDKNFHLQILTDQGGWTSIDLMALAKASMAKQGVTTWPISNVGDYAMFTADYADPSISSEIRVVFDDSCHAYAIINANRTLGYSMLLHSPDGGQTWGAYRIPGSDGAVTSVSMEIPNHRHVLGQTPVLMIRQWYRYSGSPNSVKFVIPTKNTDHSLTLSQPITVATNTISTSSVGGTETSAVSAGDSIYFVYPGSIVAYDSISGRNGTPQYAITYSRSLMKVIAGPISLGVTVGQLSETDVDEHNQPTIAQDSNGFLHVVMGGHDGPLYYRKSLNPNDISSWGNTELIGQKAGVAGAITDQYTYPSLAIDQYNQPVVLARWNGDSYYFKLIYVSRNVNTGQWNDQQIVLDPGRPYYGHWYHKLAIDPWGRLFVNYRYYPDNIFADEAIVFGNTFGRTLTPANGCVATNHDASPASYCSYTGYEQVDSTVIMSPGLGRPFHLVNTSDFFFPN